MESASLGIHIGIVPEMLLGLFVLCPDGVDKILIRPGMMDPAFFLKEVLRIIITQPDRRKACIRGGM